MSEKKRKRREDGAERPSKKVATAPQKTVRVELLENKEPLGPVLATTPGLNFPKRITFKPYTRKQTLAASTNHQLLLQSSDHARLDYTAQAEPDGSSESQLKDYVGVFDPATNKLQIVPVQRLVLRSTLRSETEEMQEEQARIEARQTMTVKRYALAAEFGSKKSRKAIDNITMNSIISGKKDGPRNDAVAENILQNMGGAVGDMPTREELAAAVDSSKPRPTPNLAAEYPGDVYPIDIVVGSELMTMLEVKDWVDACAAGVGVNVSSRYVAKRILSLARNKQIQKLKVLRFILLCIDFAAALSGPGGGSRPKKIPPKGKLEAMMGTDTPVSLVMAIRRKFAVEGSFEMPRWNIDNLMTHIAAAALIVDEFEVDVNDLRDDMKIDNKAIQAYFAELGCRVTAPTAIDLVKLKLNKAEANNHYVAKLKLPLKFPKQSIPRKGKR